MLAVFHESLRSVLGEKDTEFSEDTNVSSIESHAGFEQRDHFVLISELLVILRELFEVIRVDDDVETRDGGEFKLSSFNASHSEFLPSLGSVGFLGSVDSLLELFKSDEAGGDFSVVLGRDEEELSCFVEFFIVAAITDSLVVHGVRAGDEILEICDSVDHCVREDKRVVDRRYLDVVSRHDEELDEVLILSAELGGRNDLEVVDVILRFDETVDCFDDHLTIEVGVAELRPDFNVVDLLRVLRGSS